MALAMMRTTLLLLACALVADARSAFVQQMQQSHEEDGAMVLVPQGEDPSSSHNRVVLSGKLNEEPCCILLSVQPYVEEDSFGCHFRA